MSLSFPRSASVALLTFAAAALFSASAFAQYAAPYDPIRAGEDAYSYAETRRRMDIRRQIEWNDESRARQGIPPLFDNTVSYVPLTVASGYADSYPLFPEYGAGGYGHGGYAPGYGKPGYGNDFGAGIGNGVGYGGALGVGGNTQSAGPFGYGRGYSTYGRGAPYPATTPYPNAPVSRKTRWKNIARSLVGLPPKESNDRAYLSMFPYYNPIPQPIGSKTEQSGPDSYQTLPVYAPPKDSGAGVTPSFTAPTGREF